jgi:hypothetical protein
MIQSDNRKERKNRSSKGEPTLRELAAEYPSVWQEVIAGLRERVSSNQGEALITWRQGALSELSKSRTQKVTDGDLQQSQAWVRAKMTLLAIEQFSDVMTGKIGKGPKLKDSIFFRFFILRRLISQNTFNVDEFDRRWRRLSDPVWAAGQLQRSGIWSVPTTDVVQKIADLCKGKKTLELGAGQGLLYAALKRAGINIDAVDNESWTSHHQTVGRASRGATGVLQIDASEALKTLKPSVVICSWPPAGNSFEEDVFTTRSVDLYLVILSKQSFASGNWSAYKAQKNFECTTVPALNSLLRPVEIEQQLLIFRRRKS